MVTRFQSIDRRGNVMWLTATPDFTGDLCHMGGEFFAQYIRTAADPTFPSKLVILSVKSKVPTIVKILKNYTTSDARGCAYDGNYIYTLTFDSGYTIEKIDPKSGVAVWTTTIPTPANFLFKGMCFFEHGTGMFFAIVKRVDGFGLGDTINIYDHKFNFLYTFGAATGLGNITGICFNGIYLVTCNQQNSPIFSRLRFHDVGSTQNAFVWRSPGRFGTTIDGGVEFDGINYLVSSN